MPLMPNQYMSAKKKLPRPPTTQPLAMQADAARMGAEGLGVQQRAPAQLQAPIVPTTNMAVKKPPTAPTPSPTGAGGMSSGMAMPNVTGGQDAGAAAAAQAARSRAAAEKAALARRNAEFVQQTTNMQVDRGGTTGGQQIIDASVPPTQEELYQRAIEQLLGSGPRNTTEDERLIREQMMRDVGQGQADLGARMGAMGFGASGANAAMGADIRSRAALDASKAIAGVRQDARDEYLDKLGLGLRASNEAGSLEMRQKAYDAIQQAIADMQKPTGDTATDGLSTAPENVDNLLSTMKTDFAPFSSNPIYHPSQAQINQLRASGVQLTRASNKDPIVNIFGSEIYVDQYGNYYNLQGEG